MTAPARNRRADKSRLSDVWDLQVALRQRARKITDTNTAGYLRKAANVLEATQAEVTHLYDTIRRDRRALRQLARRAEKLSAMLDASLAAGKFPHTLPKDLRVLAADLAKAMPPYEPHPKEGVSLALKGNPDDLDQ